MDKIKYDLYSMAVHSKMADINRQKAKEKLVSNGLKPVEADVLIQDFEHKFKDEDMTFAEAGKYIKGITQEVIDRNKNIKKSV